MAVTSDIMVVSKDGNAIDFASNTMQFMQALKEMKIISGINIAKKPYFNSSMTMDFQYSAMIGRFPMYYPHHEGKDTLAELPCEKFDHRTLTFYFGSYKYDGGAKGLPQAILDSTSFMKVNIHADEIGVEIIQKLSEHVAKLLPDHLVYLRKYSYEQYTLI